MGVHSTKVDRSGATGNLVVCTCGFALGPFQEAQTARDVAREHREAHQSPRVATAEARARSNDARQRKRAERREQK